MKKYYIISGVQKQNLREMQVPERPMANPVKERILPHRSNFFLHV